MPRVSLTYDNEQVAAVLEEIADLSDLSGAKPFRAVTFRAAARAIRDLREPLRALMEQKRLSEIPKVGPAIAGALLPKYAGTRPSLTPARVGLTRDRTGSPLGRVQTTQ